jgi:deoxyribose-phosphate aldolase
MHDSMEPNQLAQYIDHTLLKSEAISADITKLCEEAIEFGFATVCIHPCHIPLAAKLLDQHPSKVCSVAGFPFGTNHTHIKELEARQAIDDGAQEIDIVANLAAALEGNTSYLQQDIKAVLRPCLRNNVILKVILETAALPTETKIMLCKICSDLGVDFIKTSTGLHPAGGVTIEDVQLLYQYRGSCKVKAAGGIRNLNSFLAMIHAGARRIGTSSSLAILNELKTKKLQ